MLKQKFSKFKRVCTFVYLPQILKHTKCGKNNIYKNRNVQLFSSTNKNKDSSTGNNGGIETIFTKNLDIDGHRSTKEDLLNGNIITPAFYNIDRCAKCQSVIDRIFGKETPKYQPEENEVIDDKLKGNLQATTATIEEEKLAQKIEVLDETSHVEAPPKLEGFNSSPKVLGQEFTNYKTPDENVISDGNYDEVAKRCLNTPVGEIDKKLLHELTNISPLNVEKNECAEEIISSYENDNTNPIVYVPERFQPIHLHTLPLFTIENSTKDFKENCSKIYTKADNKEPISDSPSPISPYDTPAMPFYEYINKERIDVDESTSVFDVIPEIQISNPIVEESLIKDDQSASSEQESLEDGKVNPQTLNYNNDSSIQSNETYNDRNLKSDHVANIFRTYQLLTGTPNHPTDSQARDVSQGEMQNSAISGVQNQNSGVGYEEPPATAISANQNPGEYFNEEFNFTGYEEKDTPMHTERPASQNVVFSSMQPRLELATPKTKLSEDIKDIKTFKKACAIRANVSETANKDIPLNPGTVPLSMLLKQIRERSQLEYCQNVLNKLEAEVAEVKCPPPDKKEACNPNPCKATPCKATPCKSKPRPEVRPCDPCQGPKKKDPCAKLLPFILNVITKSDVTLDKTVFKSNSIKTTSSLGMITEEIIDRLTKLGQKLKYLDLRANILELYEKELTFKFARDFEPWIPIPSWPIPKVEKKKPFLCPKYGCKYPVPRKPSKGKCVPKKNFSLTQLFSSPLTSNI